jgi:thioredoxin reductase
MRPYDALVIGGSWAGLSAAMQLARARRRVLLVDAGEPRNRFAHEAHGFLGQDGRPPAEIFAAARAQVLAYPTAEYRRDSASDAVASDDEFEVSFASGQTVRTRRLVLATGVVDELPNVPGLVERWGKSVLHCPYCHGFEVADRRLGVLAVGESSLHQAMLIPDWSSDVTLFTNGTFEPDSEQRERLTSRGVRIETRGVVALDGNAPELVAVHLDDGTTVGMDALFTTPRTRPASPLAERLGCGFDDGPSGPVIRTDDRKRTTVPGVFAAGDAARPTHNATWASADGVTAGVAAHQSLVFVDHAHA